MFIYISKKQQDLKWIIQKEFEKVFEETRPKNVIHKFNASTFIDTNIKVKFERGVPTQATYRNIPLGQCSLNKTFKDDVGYEIPDTEKFVKFFNENKFFTITLGSFSDGFVHGDIAYVESDGIKTDFSRCLDDD